MKIIKTLKHLFHPQRSNNHRPRLLHPKPLIFMTMIALGLFELVGFASSLNMPKGNILGYASSITISQVMEKTNQQRVSEGLVALTYNQELSNAAAGKARDMFSNQYWAHTSPSGKEPWDFIKSAGYSYKIAGENLARDFDSTSPLISAWMNSPTHRANIMNPRYREIGLAVVDGKLSGVETTLVVQMFGTKPSNTGSTKPSIEVPALADTINDGDVIGQKTENIPSKIELSDNLENEGSQNGEELPLIERQNTAKENLSESDQANVLAKTIVPKGDLSRGILFSPLHVLKAFFLSIIFLLVTVLIYDAFVVGHKNSVRLVGKNLAHIILFIFIAYLIVFFKGGVV